MIDWASAPLVGVVHDDTERSMNPQVRDLWVGALRMGVYAQGYTRLRTVEDEFTALGVLCDLATRLKVVAWDRVAGEYFISPMDPPATGAFLPRPVREWAGIKGCHPSQELPLEWAGALHPIWRLTDIYKLSFPTVAELLSAQY